MIKNSIVCKSVKFTDEDDNVYHFEGSGITAGFVEEREDFELITGEIVPALRWYRFVLEIRTPYLRSADSELDIDDSDIIELINVFDEGKEVEVEIPDYDSGKEEVVKLSKGIEVSTNKQVIIPSLDFSVQSKRVVTELPEWFKFQRNAPGYFT